jgi:outer membrane protein assembly factor BamB
MVAGLPVSGAAQLPDAPKWSVSISDPPIGAPALAGSTIVLPLQTGGLTAHRYSDGGEVWKSDVTAEQPLAADSTHVYVASGDQITALDAATGALRWRVSLGGPVTAPPVAHGGWVIAAGAGDVLAIRASDGAVIWRKHFGPVEFRSAIDGDLLVVPVSDGRALGVDLLSGAIRWEQALGSAPLEPYAIGGRVYLPTEQKTFLRLKASSGRLEPHVRVGALVRGQAAADEHHVYFAALDNSLWALDRGDGAIEWRKGITYRPAAGPVLLAGFVVVPGADVRALPAYVARTGAAAGELAFPETLSRAPVLGVSADGSTFALGITGNLANKWTLTLMGPSPVPSLTVEPLLVPPGEFIGWSDGLK